MHVENLKSSLIAGAIALIIWSVCGLIFGMKTGQIVLWAIIFYIGTTAVTFGISTMIARSKR